MPLISAGRGSGLFVGHTLPACSLFACLHDGYYLSHADISPAVNAVDLVRTQ